MTTIEALKKLHAATLSDLGIIDPEMVFGIYPADIIVEAMNAVMSCAFIGPHFSVVSADVEFAVFFRADGRINVSGMCPRRTP